MRLIGEALSQMNLVEMNYLLDQPAQVNFGRGFSRTFSWKNYGGELTLSEIVDHVSSSYERELQIKWYSQSVLDLFGKKLIARIGQLSDLANEKRGGLNQQGAYGTWLYHQLSDKFEVHWRAKLLNLELKLDGKHPFDAMVTSAKSIQNYLYSCGGKLKSVVSNSLKTAFSKCRRPEIKSKRQHRPPFSGFFEYHARQRRNYQKNPTGFIKFGPFIFEIPNSPFESDGQYRYVPPAQPSLPLPKQYPNLYGILDVAQDASQQEIRAAYRKVVFKAHPDRNKKDPKAGEKFTLIQKAYEVLKDPAKRQEYNHTGYVPE